MSAAEAFVQTLLLGFAVLVGSAAVVCGLFLAGVAILQMVGLL